MSILTKIIPKKGDSLFLWALEEDEAFFKAQLPENVIVQTSGFQDPMRRTQWLAVRHLLKSCGFPFEVSYAEIGQPIIEHHRISISHTPKIVGVYISYELQGLDLELPHNRILRISNRFMNGQEQKLFGTTDTEILTLIWSTKEALFKKYGAETTFFASNQNVLSIDHENQTVHAEVKIMEKWISEQLHFRQILDHYLVYTT